MAPGMGKQLEPTTATAPVPPTTDLGTTEDHTGLRIGGGPIPPVTRGGGAVAPLASPSTLAYDAPAVFAADRKQVALAGLGSTATVTVWNNSLEPITIGDVYVDGDAGAFRLDRTVLAGTELAPYESIELDLAQIARVAGTYHATLVVAPANGMMSGKAELRVPIEGTVDAEPTVGTPIQGTSPNGNPNTIDSAMSSLVTAWESLLQEQIAGVALVQGYAAGSDPSGVSPLWQDLLQAALMLGVVGVTRGLATRIASGLGTAIYKLTDDLHGMGAAINAYASTAAELNTTVHAAMHGQIADTLQGAIASAIRDGVVAARTGGHGKAALARDAFFEAMKSDLNFGVAAIKTQANNTTGDYQALEADHAGLGFAALESYRNQIARQAQTAKTEQVTKTLGVYGAFLAQPTTGTLGTDAQAETDLFGAGGIATDESKRGGEHFANGVLVLDMTWSTLTINSARIRGMNEDLRALLVGVPLRSLGIPIVLAGNVRNTAGKQPQHGEVRVGRNENGTLFAAAADSEDDVRAGTAYGVGFLERAARDDFNLSNDGSMPSGKTLDVDTDTAAANIFARLAGTTVTAVGDE